MWENLMGCNTDDYLNSLSEKSVDSIIEYIVSNYKVVGVGATILNGYSYIPCIYGLTIYTSVKDLNGFSSLLRKMVYLENYNSEIGYEESNVSSPERTICDYLMYPDELNAGLYLLDTLEGYEDEFGNFDKVYEMMNKLGIQRSELDKWIPYMWDED